jgi:xylulokinase
LNALNIKNVQSIRTLPSVIPGLFNAGYLLPSTGKQFSEYRKNSCYRDLSAEECMARIFDPSAEGTFLEGASTKNTSPEDSDSERAQAQRLITNIAFQVRQGTEALRTAISDAGHSASRIAGADVTAFRLSGGQARNRLWNQLKADVLGIPLELTGTPDGELVGDAVIGFTGMGHFGSIAEGAGRLVSVSQTFYPDATAHARYTELYHQWLEASCAADTVNAADGAAKATQ